MPTGGAAGDDDEVGITAVVRDALADPAQRELHVDEVVGERRARTEPVVRRDAHPPMGRELVHQRQCLLALVPDDPGAAVDLQQHGGAGHRGRRTVDVEQVAATRAVRVADVADHLDPGLGQRSASASRVIESDRFAVTASTSPSVAA